MGDGAGIDTKGVGELLLAAVSTLEPILEDGAESPIGCQVEGPRRGGGRSCRLWANVQLLPEDDASVAKPDRKLIESGR